jgi:cold shock CspA family protein
MTRTYEGVVLHWNLRGFGFLFNNEINRRIFFHVKDWNRATRPVAQEIVTFELSVSGNGSGAAGGQDVAINVTPIQNTAEVRSLAGGKN